jgi:hypothetical protein
LEPSCNAVCRFADAGLSNMFTCQQAKTASTPQSRARSTAFGSFIVQTVTKKRAARAATATPKELDWELAAREASRNIAAVHLD